MGLAARLPRRVDLVGLAAVCVIGAAACSASGPPKVSADGVVNVTERDFKIAVSPARVRAGDVVLTATNDGPENHEMIVVRRGAHALPMRADGVTIDEEALEKSTVGALEPGAAGEVRTLRLHLARGRYEIFCNMAGHFLGGMRAELVVT